MTRAWQPLLEGPLARRALAAVNDIAAAIDGAPAGTSRRHGRKPGDGPKRDASLAGGAAGVALLYDYLSRANESARDRRRATRFLAQAADAVASVHMPPSLYGGFSGVAWAMAHLENGDGATGEVDEVLRDHVNRPGWVGEYDLVSGLVGLGVYALERLPAPDAVECLEGVVDRLAETATRRRDGVTWFTPPEVLPEIARKEAPRGYYNLGLAHGVPGVIVVLGAACAARIRARKARRLLNGAVEWLLAQKRRSRSGSRFSYWISPDSKRGERAESSRSAWCYGDPGVAAALFCAARAVGKPEWEHIALRLARRDAARPPRDAGVMDAGLCHGAAGLGHLFNRLYQSSGDAELARAARFWFRRTLEMRRPGTGIAGFRSLAAREDGTRYWEDDKGLLTGASGIALALLAATTSVEPDWDRMLLLSIRNRS